MPLSRRRGNGLEDNTHKPINGSRSSRLIEVDPDERTTLLSRYPRHPLHDDYLDPDDPAVSPYNLRAVRFTRYATILLLIMTFLWWGLLLVTLFISSSKMHSRGSGFFDFAFTGLTIGNLLIALLFFSAPSQAMRVCTTVIGVLLFVDVIIIVAVPRMRHEEGGFGIASIVWAVLMAVWCIITDRIVVWGKKEEELRLTGRVETRRTVKELLFVSVDTVILAFYILVALLLTSALALRAKDASLSFPGDRYYVNSGAYQVHLACFGNKNNAHGVHFPTVMIEAGEQPSEANLQSWVHDSMQNGTISRYCYWDRPGYAWSDNAPSPHSAGMASDALSEAISLAGEGGPWILVSAGYGSLISRIFSARHPHDVGGLFMIDPLHEDLLHRIGGAGRGFTIWGWGILSPLGLNTLSGAVFKGRTSADRVYGINAYQSGKFLQAQLQENLSAQWLTKSEVSAARTIQNRDTPLVIISSGIQSRRDREWGEKQRDLATLSYNLVAWDTVDKAPHEVWRTLDGREIMKKRLGQLVKTAKVVN